MGMKTILNVGILFVLLVVMRVQVLFSLAIVMAFFAVCVNGECSQKSVQARIQMLSNLIKAYRQYSAHGGLDNENVVELGQVQ